MRTVWLLWSGTYSEKHVVGVFSSEELAREWMERHQSVLDHPRVSEAQVDRPSLWPDGHQLWVAEVCRGGDIDAKEADHWVVFEDDEHKIPSDVPGYTYYVAAESKDEAVKIASDRHRAWKAGVR